MKKELLLILFSFICLIHFIFPSSIVLEKHICEYNFDHNMIQYSLHTLVLTQIFALKDKVSVYLWLKKETH
jgi:hypothetical protein